MPQMIKIDILRTLRATSSTKAMESMAPTKAAAIITTELESRPRWRKKIMVMATTSFAPEEMPSTKGPAMGLAKNVWSRNPATESAPPSRMAASTLGRRMSHTTRLAVASLPLPRKICMT